MCTYMRGLGKECAPESRHLWKPKVLHVPRAEVTSVCKPGCKPGDEDAGTQEQYLVLTAKPSLHPACPPPSP